MLAKDKANKKNEPHSEYVCCSISQPGRKHGPRTRILSGGFPTGVGQALASARWESSSSPWEKTTGGKGQAKRQLTRTTSLWGLWTSASDEVGTGVWKPLRHLLLGCGAGPTLERNPDRISVFAPSPQTAWESLQVGIPRPTKLKEFHIDKKALFSY